MKDKNIQAYNFNSPDRISKDQIRGLLELHKEFARQLEIALTSYLRIQLEISVLSAEQLKYKEYIQATGADSMFTAFELNPLPGQGLICINYNIVKSIVDRMLGGEGICSGSNESLTDIEASLAQNVITKILKTLENVWKDVYTVNCTSVKSDSDFSLAEIANQNEIIVMVTAELKLNSDNYGLINLCLPYPMLEPILYHFSGRRISGAKHKTASNEEKLEIINKINPSVIDVGVILGKTNMKFSDIIKLKVGDTIKLNQRTDDNLVMTVNNNKKFFVKPGIVKNKISVKITERYNEADELVQNYQ